LPVFMLAWVVIGVGMAAGLYEALFATLGALYAERAGRAITGITLISGFATTLTWPAVAWLIEQVGWRYTCIGYAILLVLGTPLYLKVLPQVRRLEVRAAPALNDSSGLDRRLYLRLIWIFALGAIIMTAVSVQLVAVLQGLGHSLAGAIALAALLGPSQVSSRILQMLAGKRHPIWTALISVVLIAVGLFLVVCAPGATAIGLVLFGLGNGLRAIVRGLLPLALMPPAQYVAMMGKMSRPSLIGQAITPLACGYLQQHFGAMGVLSALCVLALISLILVLSVLPFVRHSASV
jgi:predicted MFS family arabinose efflux permease